MANAAVKWVSLNGGKTVVGEREGEPFVAYTNCDSIEDAVMSAVDMQYGQIVEYGEWPIFEGWMVDEETPAPPQHFNLNYGHTCVGKLWFNDTEE